MLLFIQAGPRSHLFVGTTHRFPNILASPSATGSADHHQESFQGSRKGIEHRHPQKSTTDLSQTCSYPRTLGADAGSGLTIKPQACLRGSDVHHLTYMLTVDPTDDVELPRRTSYMSSRDSLLSVPCQVSTFMFKVPLSVVVSALDFWLL
ncbi:hypothetical protein EDC04DRAFT_1572643 [Pisolithus marmoratus]|nr:hypothetical protein EDC04DRAFT_1572643 [Pisolithus marmoratus]